MRHLIALVFIIIANPISAQTWNPNAGLITPYKANVTASSGSNLANISDNRPGTYWESGNPLPNAYLSEKWNNFFLQHKNYSISPSNNETHLAFDGNTNTKASLQSGVTTITFPQPQELYIASLKARVQDSLQVILVTSDNQHLTYHYKQQENYQVKSFSFPQPVKMVSIILKSDKPYDLFEIGILNHLPTEQVIFDYQKPVKIGWLTTRQLNESVKEIKVKSSNDGTHWKKIMSLNPKAIPLLQIPLPHPVTARFLKIEYVLPVRDYVKARLWEFNVYDQNGPYGARPKAKPSKYSYSEAFGLNTIWGWGYNVYSDLLKPDTGPSFFNKVAHQLRSYHRLDWDMKTPKNPPDFTAMAQGKGTPAESWLNWNREYKNWKQHGFHIDVTVMFKQANFPDSLWTNPVKESENYGRQFGAHFFKRDPLLQSVEIGNEPWDYPPATYKQVLLGMSQGIKSTAQKSIVLPCAVQAYDPNNDNNNYIDQYLNQMNAPYLDALNTHIYSYVFKENGTRVAVNPEDPRSEVWSMDNIVRFRNHNMPNKGIYVTEFGYDSHGGKENCTHSECVSETLQAVYGTRMALLLWRLGADKMYWYYFANVQYKSYLHNRSGLCGSYATGFAPKKSFFAFEKLLKLLGPYHFEKIVEENQNVFAYLYENPNNGKKVVIAWRPTGSDYKQEQWANLPFTGKIVETGSIVGNEKVEYQATKNHVKVKLNGIPVYFKLSH